MQKIFLCFLLGLGMLYAEVRVPKPWNPGFFDGGKNPAERADVDTVDAHLQTLSGDDREIYRLLTKKIVALAKQKNPERDYEQLEAHLMKTE